MIRAKRRAAALDVLQYSHSNIDILSTGLGDDGNLLVVRRIEDVDGSSLDSGHELVVDEET